MFDEQTSERSLLMQNNELSEMGMATVSYLLESQLFVSFQNSCRKPADRLAFEGKKEKKSKYDERTDNFYTLQKCKYCMSNILVVLNSSYSA